MKKIHYIILSVILLVTPLINGCSGYLNEENVRIPVADVYYKTPAGIKDLSNSCYSYTRYFYGNYSGWQMNILGTDLWLNGGDGPNTLGYYTMTTSDDPFWITWKNFYLGITACNTLLARLNDATGLTQDELNNYAGQAYFMRALYYHVLVMNFGDIPLVLDETKEVSTTATRTSEKAVYSQIINDLLQAEQMLPSTQSDYGRAAKPAAEALLARVYLWNGQNDKAYELANKVITGYNFKLLPNYADVFNINAEKNAEVIWSIQYTADQLLAGDGNVGHALFLMRYDIWPGMVRDIANDRPFRHYMPSRYFLNSLQQNRWRDSRFDKVYTTVWKTNKTSGLLPNMVFGDTALFVPPYAVSAAAKSKTSNKYTTLDIDYYYEPTSPNGEVPRGARQTFPSLNKFQDPLRVSIASTVGRRDFIVLRLSEMYLIAAEALMKQGKTNEGVDFINAVRLRAAWPGKEDAMKLTASQLTIDAILDERAFELEGECVGRWADLKRTGKLLERVKLYNPDARPNIKEKHLLRPIPQNMIDRISNKSEFPQNPGY